MDYSKSLLDEYLESSENQKIFNQECLIESVTDQIFLAMEKTKTKPSELASLMRLSKARISKMLDGNSNFRLRTLSDFGTALDYEVFVNFTPKKPKVNWASIDSNTHIQPRIDTTEKVPGATIFVFPERKIPQTTTRTMEKILCSK